MNWLIRLLTFVLFLGVAGSVGAVIVLERASRYPVEANFLTPWLERNASEQIDGGIVSIDKTRIALHPGKGGARLLLTGVSASGGPASEPLNIGEMAVAVSLPDLMLGRMRLTRVSIDDLSFAARRESNGTFGFSVAPSSGQDDLMNLEGVPAMGSVAEAATLPEAASAGDLAAAPTLADDQSFLDQLRAALLERSGLLSRFEELELTNGSLIFDDVEADERIVIHDATLTFAATRDEAQVAIDGLFEVGNSFASGRVALTTPLEARGLELRADLSDMAIADLAAYLPRQLLPKLRTDAVDLQFEGRFSDQGTLQRFSVKRFAPGSLLDADAVATAAPVPTLSAIGTARKGGAGGWNVALKAPAETFQSEPVLEDVLGNVFDFDGTLSGAVDFNVAEDGRLLDLNFNAALGSGSVTIPALYRQPVTLSSARFIGTYRPEGLRFDVLEVAPIINGRALPSTRLDLSIDTPNELTQRVRFGVQNDWALSAQDIMALWPNTNEDDGRKWFREHVARGQTTGQSLSLDIETVGPTTTLRDLQANIGFNNGAFKLSDGLGYSRDTAGRMVIDKQLFSISLDRATLGPTTTRNTSVRIDLRSPDDPRLVLEGEAQAPLRDGLAFLVGADVGLDDLGSSIPIERSAGRVVLNGDMTLSLANPPRFRPDYDLQIALSDLQVDNYLAGLPIRASSLPIRITPRRIATGGSIFLGDIASDATLELTLDKGDVQSLRINAAYNGKIADAQALLGPLPDYVSGRMSGELTYLQDQSGRRIMDINANLGRSTIDLSPLPYFKPSGQPARAEARLIFNENGLAQVDSFKVDGPALHLAGMLSLTADGKALAEARMSNIIVGDSNLGSLRLLNEREFVQVRIQDGQLDGRPIIQSILDNQGKREGSIVSGNGTDTSSEELNSKPLLINISNIRRFVVPGGKAFTDIDLSATIDDGAVIQFLLDAQAPAHVPGRAADRGRLSASLTPQANGFYRLSFESDDAGALFSTLNLTNEVRGGVIAVSAESALPLPKGGWLGSMELRDFTIVDAPIMVQLLSLASLTGILELAAGGGLQFTELNSNFTFGNSALYLDDLRMTGPSVGLSTEGSIDFNGQRFALQGNVTPFNLVSEIAGSIPVIGQVLTGTDGGGVFSAGYKIDGPFASPTISVNPFQILTPGVYRQWFQDIMGNS